MTWKTSSVGRLLLGIVAFLFVVAPAAARAASVLGTPILIVYPFASNGGDITREAGAQFAVTIATQIANLGGVEVRPAQPGIDRQDFLDKARQSNADYYIAGYMTPLGDGVSVVEQLVSTKTGIVVFSNSAQVRTLADATGQGDVLREALLQHQTRNLGAYAAPPPPAAAPSTTPNAGNAAQANLGHLFSHRQKRTPVGTPTPTPQIALRTVAPMAKPTETVPLRVANGPPPASTYAILAIAGTAGVDRRSYAGVAIRNDLVAKRRAVDGTTATRDSACRAGTIGILLGGDLATSSHTVLGRPQTTATLEFRAYDCAGNIVFHRTLRDDSDGGWKSAVNVVVAGAVSAFLHDPAATRRG